MRITVDQAIAAPADLVFRAVSDVANLPETNDDIVEVVFLTEQRSGAGTRFKETRRMGNNELVTELEVLEFDPEARCFRAVSDTHGTVWDTVMRVEPDPSGSRLVIVMDAHGHTWFKRVMNRVMSPLFRRGLRQHLAKLAAYCERTN